MPRKHPQEERRLILLSDQRRKYGARLVFQVQRSQYIGDLENVTLLLEDGTLASIEPGRLLTWEGGKRYIINVTGFPTAREAEDAGMRMAQALSITAVSLNFGLRLNYQSHEPPTVFDRTINKGLSLWGDVIGVYSQEIILRELMNALKLPLKDRRLLLSMELFAAATLESNDRARFVMTVSALEPLAVQQNLGSTVDIAVANLVAILNEDTTISADVRESLRGRLLQLRRESVRQALKRLCAGWFPNDIGAWLKIDQAYALRSQLLHEGRPNDLDILLTEETRTVSNLLRRIYQQAFSYSFLAPVAA